MSIKQTRKTGAACLGSRRIMTGNRRRGIPRDATIDQATRSARIGVTRVVAVLAFASMLLGAGYARADLTNGLVAYWSFDTGFAATYGGTAYDGNPINGPAIDPEGKFGGAARFERANGEYAVVTTPVIMQGQDHTYSAWYQLDVANITSTNRYFVLETKNSAGTDAYSASYGLRDLGAGDLGQVFTESSGGAGYAASVPGGAGAAWHNIIVTYDADRAGAQHAIYLDGRFVGNLASSPVLMPTAGLVIGGHRAGTGRNWQGMIDDVGFWSRVLTPDEIAALQSGPIVPVTIEFAAIAADLPGVNWSSVAWGDYDNDGDLDILLTGMTELGRMSRVYRNDGGSFVDIAAGLVGAWDTSAAWGDYDNDGDLDILLAGSVYRNDGGSFEAAAWLEAAWNAAVAWGDYDNDGDLDILRAGETELGWISRVYRNDGGSFEDIAAGLVGVSESSVAWGDYDNDGDLDILLAGMTELGRISRVYRNDGGSFEDIAAGLVGVNRSSVAWGDYDNDGDLDILLAGGAESGMISRVYRNDGGSFVDIAAGLVGAWNASVAWGDYDNDGDLDILLAGMTELGRISRVYRNDGGSFEDIAAGLVGVSKSSVAWGDYDNDGDLDILLAGESASGSISRVYRNNTPNANTPPSAPTNLSAQLTGATLALSWDAATDAQTPSPGLSYNVRVGTSSGGGEIWASMSSASDGFRRVVQTGNAQKRTSWTVTLPGSVETYYWTVQAVDGAFAGSEFAPVKTAVGGTPDLVIGDGDLGHRVVDDQHWELTATVHNAGDGVSQNTKVRFLDARTGAQIGADVPIGPLGPGNSIACRLEWDRRCGHDQFRAHVDPEAGIRETSDGNNSAQHFIPGVPECPPPRIGAVTAAYGQLDEDGTFGRYIKGIKGSKERFTASVVDAADIVTRVRFAIGGETIWADRTDDGWVAEFDPGTLREASTPMRVQPFSGDVSVGQEYVGSLLTNPGPAWLWKWFKAPENPQLPARLQVIDECPYLTFWIAASSETELDSTDAVNDPGLIYWQDLIDPDIPFLGGNSTKFEVNLELEINYPLLGNCGWSGKGSLGYDARVFGKGESRQYGLELYMSRDGESIDSLKVEAGSRILLYEFPEVTFPKEPSPPLIPIPGVALRFGFSMDVFLEWTLRAEFFENFDRLLIDFFPAVAVDAEIKGVVSLAAIPFAQAEIILSPEFKLGPGLQYKRGYPSDNGLSVSGRLVVKIDGRVVASITYKVWKYKRKKSWEIVKFTLVDKTWQYPRGASSLDVADGFAAADSDSVVIFVPDVLPYPNAASHRSGKVGFTWIADVNQDPDLVEPQVYYAELDSLGNWPWVAVTSDLMFKSYAALAYLPDGTPLAVWVQASHSEAETDSTWTLSEVLDRQDLRYAVRGPAGWSRAAVFAERQGVNRADGVPALASTDDGAMLVWARAVNGDSALAQGCSEIFVSKYSAGAWSNPDSLTDDRMDDTRPAICSTGGDTTLVLWLRKDASIPEAANSLVWSMWDGSTWRRPHETLSASSWTKQPPSVVRARGAAALAAWVETELTLPDSNVVYHLRSATFDASTAAWSPIQEVFADSLFVESPIAIVDRQNIAVLHWRGYNGMDGDRWYSSRDLKVTGSQWTLPSLVEEDSLTDWMATAAVDSLSNLHFIDLKSDLANPPQMTAAKSTFPGGLTLMSRRINGTLDLSEGLNISPPMPLSCDLWLDKRSVAVDDEDPAVGTSAPLVAVVRNSGDKASPASFVRFYNAHPDSGGSPLPGGDIALPVLAPDESVTVQTAWPVASGSHRLYAVVDPDSTVREQKDDNNSAYAEVNIVPDVAVDSVWVSNVKPKPGDVDTVKAWVRNLGGAPVDDLTVRFGNRAGTLGALTGLSLPPKAALTLAMPTSAVLGIDTLRVVADPDSALVDRERNNNQKSRVLRVLPDLGVVFDTFSLARDSLWLPDLGNFGSWNFWDATNLVTIRIYAGNPRDGGVQLGPDIRLPMPPQCHPWVNLCVTPPQTGTVCDGCIRICVPFSDSVDVCAGFPPGGTHEIPPIPWQEVVQYLQQLGIPVDPNGIPVDPITFYVVIDPDGEYPDLNRANNVAFLHIGVGVPQLTVAANSIGFRYEPAVDDTLYARIVNRGSTLSLAVPVAFYDGDPDAGGTLIADRLVPALAVGDTALVRVAWESPMRAFTIFVVVDPENKIAEKDETDNRANRLFDITPVTVTDMAAAMIGTSVSVSWRVQSLEDVAGFRLHRSIDGAALALLTTTPLPARKGSMTYLDVAADVPLGARLVYRLEVVSTSGETEFVGVPIEIRYVPSVPARSALHQNVPNPFNPVTRIRFDLARDAHVKLRIYDLAGRLVRTLLDRPMQAGWNHQVLWRGFDDRGNQVASGIYFYRLEAAGYASTRKLVLIR